MNLCVVKLFEDNFQVGLAVTASNWDEAYRAAEEFALGEYEARKIDASEDPTLIQRIQEDFREDNYHFIDGELGEIGKGVAVQIIILE